MAFTAPETQIKPVVSLDEILRTRTNRRIEANDAKGVATLDAAQQGTPFDYVLMVSTLEPRKNHAALVAAWEELRSGAFPKVKLVIVGMLGLTTPASDRKMETDFFDGRIFDPADLPAYLAQFTNDLKFDATSGARTRRNA